MSNITLNIVEPGSGPAPDPVVPNTGLFTHGIGGPEATIITAVSTVLLLTIVAVVVAMLYKKHKKQGKATKLVSAVDACATVVKSKKRVSAGLATVALLVSAGTFAGLLINAGKSNTSATEGEDGNSLTVDVSNEELTIEVGDEPIFAVLPVEVSVEEATEAGYTLTAYADSTDLVSTTDESKTISMVAIEGDELAALTDNTYGLALAKPESKDEEVYTTLSTDADNPTFVTDKDYEHTDANDTTTIYYGFYVTPDMPYGVYVSSDINYAAETNRADLATVIYNGNGLYFDENEGKATNKVRYEKGLTDYTKKYSHTPNLNDEGDTIPSTDINYGTYINDSITIPGATKVKVSLKYGIVDENYRGNTDEYWAYMTIWQGNHPEYTAADDYDEGIRQCGDMTTSDGRINGYTYEPVTVECELSGDSVTFGFWTQPEGGPTIGYGYYATVTGYDADGNIVYLPGNNLVSGEYLEPAQNLPYVFLGWSEDKNATMATYESVRDIALYLSLIEGKTTNLYAVWQHATEITFDGNGSDGGPGLSDKLLAAGNSTELCNGYGWAAYTKTGYAFVGWNTKPDGSGTAYSNCYQYVASVDQSAEFTLYAQWAEPTVITFNGNGSDSGREIPDRFLAPGEHTNLCNNWQGPPAYTRTGYNFAGWNTVADGGGKFYENCYDYVAPDEPTTITLYAQWAE